MKKHLLLLAGLMILAPYGQADAKAVKLGRGNAYSVAADTNVNAGASGTQINDTECSSNKDCPNDKTCSSYKCISVCAPPFAGAVPPCAGLICITDPVTPHAFKCVDRCYNFVCNPGYTTNLTSSGDCECIPASCPAGQRLSGNQCVDNCTGISCKSGYEPVSNDTGCCCEKESLCPAGQIYNEVIQKCVQAICPTGCSQGMCKKGYCEKCDTGYYLNYSNGLCPTCESAIPNCAACTSSASGPKCTQCKFGTLNASGTECTITTLPSPDDWPTGCPPNTQNCGATGCCPKDHSCAYYAAPSTTYKCFIKNFNDNQHYIDPGLIP